MLKKIVSSELASRNNGGEGGGGGGETIKALKIALLFNFGNRNCKSAF